MTIIIILAIILIVALAFCIIQTIDAWKSEDLCAAEIESNNNLRRELVKYKEDLRYDYDVKCKRIHEEYEEKIKQIEQEASYVNYAINLKKTPKK